MARYQLIAANCPPKNNLPVIRWGGRAQGENELAIDLLLDQNFEKYRQKYQYFCQTLLLKKKDGISIRDWLTPSFDDFSLLYFSSLFARTPYLDPSIYQLLKIFILEELIEKFQIKELIVDGIEDNIVDFLKTQFDSIEVKKVIKNSQKEKWWGLTFFRHLFLWLITKIFVSRDHFLENAASVVTYFPFIDKKRAERGEFYSHYFGGANVKIKSQFPRVNWILYYDSYSEMSYRQAFQLIKKLRRDHEHFVLLDQLNTLRGLLHSLKIFFFIRRKIQNIDWLFQFEERNYSYLLKSEFKRSLGTKICLYRLIRREQFKRMSSMIKNSKALIYVMENQPWEFALNFEWRKQQKSKILGYQHVLARPFDFRYYYPSKDFALEFKEVYPDFIGVVGQDSIQQLMSLGHVPHDQIQAVEAVKYEKLKTLYHQFERGDSTLFVSLGYKLSETNFQLELLRVAADRGVLKKYSLIFKFHPFARHQIDLVSMFKKDVQNVVVTERAVEEILKEASVIFCSNSGSIALEASWYGAPVIIAAAFNELNFNALLGHPQAKFVYQAADFMDALENPVSIDLPENYFYFSSDMQYWDAALNTLKG